MIDLRKIPTDITKHIENFRIYLNIAWDHVIYKIMDSHDWDEDGRFIDDWMQINWELLVARELLGKEFCLSQFSSTHLSKNIIHPNRNLDYLVLIKFDKGLKDVKSRESIPSDKPLRLFTFKTIDKNSNSLVFSPPFDLAGVVHDETQKLYTVPFNMLKCFLHKAH